jgi:hypothetical protein
MVEGDEPEIVRVSREVRTVPRAPDEFDTAFAEALVYARRTTGGRPGVMVSTLPGRGRWVLAFSTPERLAAFGRDRAWLRMRGADLLAELPAGVGVLFDPGEDHGLPLLPRVSGPPKFAGVSGGRSS